MRCDHCKRKRITIECSWCKNQYCSGCIQLEIHMCKNIHLKIEKEKKIIEEKNVQIVSKKI
jgi:hypothetical protein